MALFMGQYLIGFYAYPWAVFIEVAGNGILKSFFVEAIFNIDIAAGKGRVWGMRVGIACEIAPGKFAGGAPGNQVVRLYNGDTH